MNKGVVVFLFENGWSQVKIARRFCVTPGRISQIVNEIKEMSPKRLEDGCEICGKHVEKKDKIRVGGRMRLLVCDDCIKKIKQYLD